MPAVEIVCLANSRKWSGRCMAGLRTDGRGWVRPVLDGPTGALRPWHYLLKNRTPAQVLDLLRIDLAEPRPRPHQPENQLIGRTPWELVARPAPDRVACLLAAHLVRGPDLLGNRTDSAGYRDLVREPAASSLALVAPSELKWHVREARPGDPKPRAAFWLSGVFYDLAITDPLWEERLRSLPRGYHPLTAPGLKRGDRLLLTVSLGDPFPENGASGRCYKLVAAIIVVPPSWREILGLG